MMKSNSKYSFFVIATLFFVQLMVAQENRITGTVVDEDAVPIPGVNIIVEGTSKGTLTDFDGHFNLVVERNQTLIFTAVGYEDQTFTVENDGDIKITMTAGSVLDEVVLVGSNLAQVARERETPVAVSGISGTDIQNKLGNREFPEIMASTPSVYTTPSGGGYGDGRINIRGFAANNIAVVINGQPVNDMEAGTVYWSNWTGLADIASSLQIQRGLGASRLVVPSVGGTINIVTKTTDTKEGGRIATSLGNDGYNKFTAQYSTGMNGKWGATVLLSRWQGNGYVDGTKGHGYSWFISTGFKPNDQHSFNLMATGAPQYHNTRRSSATGVGSASLADFIKHGKRYNPQSGSLNGSEFNVAPNFFHKPIASLNWDWKINDKLQLATVAYGSWGRGGGGTGLAGSIRENGNSMDYRQPQTGLVDWDMIYNYNQGMSVTDYSGNTFQRMGFVAPNGIPSSANGQYIVNPAEGNGIVRRQSVNSHDWYGLISDLQYQTGNWTMHGGIDLKTYKGEHYGILTEFLGADGFYLNDPTGNVNAPNGLLIDRIVKPRPLTKLRNAQRLYFDYDGLVNWSGIFGQIEYTNEKISTFVQASASNQSYKRVDRMQYEPSEQRTKWHNKVGVIAKTGLNFNIDKRNNVFFNVGTISRQPQFAAVFLNNTNVHNENSKNEKIFSVEVGYGFKSTFFDVNINAYRTKWSDRFISQLFTAQSADVSNFPNLVENQSYYYTATGVNQLHQGVELEVRARPVHGLKLHGTLSLGDWKYDGDAGFSILNTLTNHEVSGATGTIGIKGLKVGDAAQITAALGADYRILNEWSVTADWNYFNKLYTQFNPINFVDPEAHAKGVVGLPSYQLFDLGTSYKIHLNNNKALNLNLMAFNLFNTGYISEMATNVQANEVITNNSDPNFGKTYAEAGRTYRGIADANIGFLGFGRTWSASISFEF